MSNAFSIKVAVNVQFTVIEPMDFRKLTDIAKNYKLRFLAIGQSARTTGRLRRWKRTKRRCIFAMPRSLRRTS
jgi:hypothetical protein